MRTVHVLVQGTVQGVGFRYHCAYTAQELGAVSYTHLTLPTKRIV